MTHEATDTDNVELGEHNAGRLASVAAERPVLERPLRIGVLGTRHVHAVGLAGGMHDLGHEIVGGWDEDAGARAGWGEHFPVASGRDALLDSVDTVIVAGTNMVRADDAAAALRAGKAVLAEKPIAVSEDALDRIRAAADTPGARFMVALPLRFAPALEQAKAAIDGGQIGRVLAARGTNHGQYPGGWFGDPALSGGGALVDHVVHVADGMCWLFGQRVERVYAAAATRMHPGLAVDDSNVVTLDFANGVFASVDGSWSRPNSFHTWGDIWLEIIGTEGRIVIDPMASAIQLFDDGAGKLRTIGYGTDFTRTMLSAFAEYAANGGDSPVSLAEAIHASEIVLAAYRSAASGDSETI